MSLVMTQVLTTPYFGSWSEVHFERNKSNWLESYPKSHHYSRKRKPLEEVQQILCDNSSLIDAQSILRCGRSEHNLRTKRIIKKCSIPDTNQKITSFFVDRKFSRPSIRSDKFISSFSNNTESPRKCTSENSLSSPDIPERNSLATELENSVPVQTTELTTNGTNGVAVPSWRTRIYTGKYIIEGTEDLGDKVFEERHLKYETSEKKRKKRDEKCLEEQERLGKLNRSVTTCYSHEKKVLHIEILENEPKCAFGYVIPDIPQEDFDLPPEYFTFRRVRQRKPSKADSIDSECSSLLSIKFKKIKKTPSVDESL